MNENRINDLVTVITPTYNRANILSALYISLKKQTNKNFIWLIIDDGSTDLTTQVVQNFIEENYLNIQYIKQENGGKHRALNNGVKNIYTELTFIVDSDDILTEDSIQSIYDIWGNINEKEMLCGISFLRGYTNTKTIGKRFPNDTHIDTFNNIRINKNITGDKAEIWVTKLLQETPFLEFKNEKFFGENYVWVKLSKKYNMVFVNKIIYITEYLDGGLTKSGRKLRINCPLGGMANAECLMSREFKLKVRIKNSWLYICYGLFANKSIKKIINDTENKKLIIFNFAFAYALFRLWNWKYNKS